MIARHILFYTILTISALTSLPASADWARSGFPTQMAYGQVLFDLAGNAWVLGRDEVFRLRVDSAVDCWDLPGNHGFDAPLYKCLLAASDGSVLWAKWLTSFPWEIEYFRNETWNTFWPAVNPQSDAGVWCMKESVGHALFLGSYRRCFRCLPPLYLGSQISSGPPWNRDVAFDYSGIPWVTGAGLHSIPEFAPHHGRAMETCPTQSELRQAVEDEDSPQRAGYFVTVDLSGDIWASERLEPTEPGHLVTMTPPDGSTTTIEPKSDTYSGNPVSLMFAPRGEIWLVTTEAVYLWDSDGRHILAEGDMFGPVSLSPDGSVWLTIHGDGVYYLADRYDVDELFPVDLSGEAISDTEYVLFVTGRNLCDHAPRAVDVRIWLSGPNEEEMDVVYYEDYRACSGWKLADLPCASIDTLSLTPGLWEAHMLLTDAFSGEISSNEAVCEFVVE